MKLQLYMNPVLQPYTHKLQQSIPPPQPTLDVCGSARKADEKGSHTGQQHLPVHFLFLQDATEHLQHFAAVKWNQQLENRQLEKASHSIQVTGGTLQLTVGKSQSQDSGNRRYTKQLEIAGHRIQLIERRYTASNGRHS